VELNRGDGEGISKDGLEGEGDVVDLWEEDGVWVAFEAGPCVGSEVLVLVLV